MVRSILRKVRTKYGPQFLIRLAESEKTGEEQGKRENEGAIQITTVIHLIREEQISMACSKTHQ